VILSANLGVSLNAPKRVFSYRLITDKVVGSKKEKMASASYQHLVAIHDTNLLRSPAIAACRFCFIRVARILNSDGKNY
jgi:hypothetical protein